MTKITFSRQIIVNAPPMLKKPVSSDMVQMLDDIDRVQPIFALHVREYVQKAASDLAKQLDEQFLRAIRGR